MTASNLIMAAAGATPAAPAVPAVWTELGFGGQLNLYLDSGQITLNTATYGYELNDMSTVLSGEVQKIRFILWLRTVDDINTYFQFSLRSVNWDTGYEYEFFKWNAAQIKYQAIDNFILYDPNVPQSGSFLYFTVEFIRGTLPNGTAKIKTTLCIDDDYVENGGVPRLVFYDDLLVPQPGGLSWNPNNITPVRGIRARFIASSQAYSQQRIVITNFDVYA
jgi:hypothetical protein